MSAIKCTGTVTLLSTFVTPDAQFDKVHVDIVGPAPPCAELIIHEGERLHGISELKIVNSTC